MFIKLSIDFTVDVNHTQQRARHESWKLIMAAKYLPGLLLRLPYIDTCQSHSYWTTLISQTSNLGITDNSFNLTQEGIKPIIGRAVISCFEFATPLQ